MKLKSIAPASLKRFMRILKNKRTPRDLLLSELPKNAIGAEVGVWKGEFSSRLFKELTPLELHLIDPWKFQDAFPDRMYGGVVAKSQEDMDDIYNSVAEMFAKHPNVKLHRGTSDNILKSFPDAYFDFIYIDGNHYYDFVLNDLNLSYKKIKKGGLLTGDDYIWGKDDGYPVKCAVEDFMKYNNINSNRLRIFRSQFLIKV